MQALGSVSPGSLLAAVRPRGALPPGGAAGAGGGVVTQAGAPMKACGELTLSAGGF